MTPIKKHRGLIPTLNPKHMFVYLFILLLPAKSANAEIVTVALKDSKVVTLKGAPEQVSISDSDVADVKILSSRKLLVMAKQLGQTRITVIDKSSRILNYLVQVTVPINTLTNRLMEIFPRQAIRVQAAGDTIVLSGTVDSVMVSERAAQIATAHLKASGQNSKVLNFLTIRGRQQVQLKVKIAEVSRSALKQIGVNAWHRNADRAAGILAPGTRLDQNLAPELGTNGNSLPPGGGVVGSGTSVPPVPMINPPFVTGAFGLLFSTQDSSAFPLSIALNLLAGKGLAKILSEPSLVAYSGQKASFLSGGEFPVPIPQGLGQTGIEFKKFGVQLAFTPTVLNDQQIQLKVSTTVSDRDESAAVQIQGTSVPGLATRNSETTVQLKDGQSFAIAGLLQEKVESTNSKIPLLGDLPLLGMFFRQSSFRRSESELVILVTANLVRPLNPGEVPPLPGEDEQSDPGALRFFLLGTTDAEDPIRHRRGPAGPVGFVK